MVQRNYGLDLLRMAAMFMVLLLHTMGQGGILEHLSTPHPIAHLSILQSIA